ncbi:MAG: protein-disulfide reductase DsbD N-terminal domain-containing protein [Planctomycetota bacterium]|jgi:DsbC/DsbD-like thiol-disulfide interchange protein
MKTFLCLAVVLGAGVGVSLTLATAGGVKRSDSVVKVKARLDKAAPPGKAVVVVSLDIQPGWHLYANPVGNEEWEQSRVLVKVTGADAKVEYPPPGRVLKDAKLGSFNIYENKVDIRATVDRVPTEANPLQLTVRLSSCDDKECLPPSTVKVSVP